MSSRIEQLRSLGQSVWLDFIRRGHLVSGEFERLIEIGVAGVTSNPTIFHQAITESDDYDAALHELVPKGLKAVELFDALAIEDIQMACDRLRPVYERTGGLDGRGGPGCVRDGGRGPVPVPGGGPAGSGAAGGGLLACGPVTGV